MCRQQVKASVAFLVGCLAGTILWGCGRGSVAPTDAVWLAKGAVKTGNMTVEDTIAVLRDQVATFLEVHLRGQSTAVPLAKSAAFSDVAVANLEQSACSQRQLLHAMTSARP